MIKLNFENEIQKYKFENDKIDNLIRTDEKLQKLLLSLDNNTFKTKKYILVKPKKTLNWEKVNIFLNDYINYFKQLKKINKKISAYPLKFAPNIISNIENNIINPSIMDLIHQDPIFELLGVDFFILKYINNDMNNIYIFFYLDKFDNLSIMLEINQIFGHDLNSIVVDINNNEDFLFIKNLCLTFNKSNVIKLIKFCKNKLIDIGINYETYPKL